MKTYQNDDLIERDFGLNDDYYHLNGTLVVSIIIFYSMLSIKKKIKINRKFKNSLKKKKKTLASHKKKKILF